MSESRSRLTKVGKKGRWVERHINNFSDGEERWWPEKPKYRPSPEENYLILLGTAWIESEGLQEQGVNYNINKLPEGYATFETEQPAGPQVYKRLFGHPTGRFYDSCARFQPHFMWLMNGMVGDCICILCSKGSQTSVKHRERRPRDTVDPSSMTRLPRATRALGQTNSNSSTRESSAAGIASGRARRDVRQPGTYYAVDEEGNEDVFKVFIRRLEANKTASRGIDQDIREVNSIDWRAEHEEGEYGSDLLPTYLTQIEHQHAFVPRLGELVLWYAHSPADQHLMREPHTFEYKFYSFKTQTFHHFPRWRAGVVTAVPSANVQNGSVDFPDILDLPNKKTSADTAAFRIETLPDPNDSLSKSASKQYKFVPLRNVRPLSHWQKLLHNIPERKLHPSIKHALTCSTTISLLEKFKADGAWPNASIHCKGLYLGSELITVGETLRLLPESSDKCTDVLVVDSIRLNLEGIKSEHVERSSPYLAARSHITIIGRAFTFSPDRRYREDDVEMLNDRFQRLLLPEKLKEEEIKTVFRPVGTAEHGDLYWLHPTNKRFEVSHDQVLGRLYEADAVRLWTGQSQHKPRNGEHHCQSPDIDFDVSGILAARRYATASDERLSEPQGDKLNWFWADSRAEALAVETLGGVEVGKYHDLRDGPTLNEWHTQMRVLNGLAVQSEIAKFVETPGGTRGRKAGSRVVNGRVVYPGDTEYEAAFSTDETSVKVNSSMAEAALASTDEGDEGGDENGDEDEDEKTNDVKMDHIPAWNFKRRSESEDDSESEVVESTKARPGQAKTKKLPLTKEQIMSNAMQSIEGDSEGDLDEDSWVRQPVPRYFARGGTEESSGGDYRPDR